MSDTTSTPITSTNWSLTADTAIALVTVVAAFWWALQHAGRAAK